LVPDHADRAARRVGAQPALAGGSSRGSGSGVDSRARALEASVIAGAALRTRGSRPVSADRPPGRIASGSGKTLSSTPRAHGLELRSADDWLALDRKLDHEHAALVTSPSPSRCCARLSRRGEASPTCA
jgi:hypothetical protein